ncbi:pentapeptide repeat-containing protein [Paenibacillus alvei]|uniref:pentapeptide repeat-containing protein n=1 Tax=Paenibacillus alvei TaxID=44250 RepID=UPI0013DA1039|nr:pentapeptide repeat-containing protein [Paenibacillus alvei]NEZ40667.1 pentapeptide repeat-containing protein [Paenibacillus alvei]
MLEGNRDYSHTLHHIDWDDLRADCENCFGLCCVALPFAASVDFAMNKDAGVPCSNLQANYRCGIHTNLRERGCKGCTVFECFGAGQKVSQITFEGIDWREGSERAETMYNVFPIMHQLHEMLWYLHEALMREAVRSIRQELNMALTETIRLTELRADELLKLDVPTHRANVNMLLVQTSELVWLEVRRNLKDSSKGKRKNYHGADLMGAKFKAADFKGANFRGAYLIAADLKHADLRGADFIGADLRDADLRGADLRDSIFLTQVQINAAKGDAHTKLPGELFRPAHWTP